MLADVDASDLILMDQAFEFSGAVGYRTPSRCVSGTSCWRPEGCESWAMMCEMRAESGPARPLGIIASVLNPGNSAKPFLIVDNSARASARGVYPASRWTMVD